MMSELRESAVDTEQQLKGRMRLMHSVFYIIGVVVVILAVLSLLGLA